MLDYLVLVRGVQFIPWLRIIGLIPAIHTNINTHGAIDISRFPHWKLFYYNFIELVLGVLGVIALRSLDHLNEQFEMQKEVRTKTTDWVTMRQFSVLN